MPRLDQQKNLTQKRFNHMGSLSYMYDILLKLRTMPSRGGYVEKLHKLTYLQLYTTDPLAAQCLLQFEITVKLRHNRIGEITSLNKNKNIPFIGQWFI